jgi:hypothetical protein
MNNCRAEGKRFLQNYSNFSPAAGGVGGRIPYYGTNPGIGAPATPSQQLV